VCSSDLQLKNQLETLLNELETLELE